MGALKLRFLKSRESKNVEEVFLIEALGRVCAQDVGGPAGGGPALAKGALIGPPAIGSLAALGIDRVPVYRKPRVSIVIAGRAPALPASSRGLGRAYDSNAVMLRAALESLRMRPVFVRRLMNKPLLLLQKVMPFALNQSDIVILLIDESHSEPVWIRSLKKITDAKMVFHSDQPDPRSAAEPNGKKVIFCLPNDSGLILDSFYKNIQPLIRSFMAG